MSLFGNYSQQIAKNKDNKFLPKGKNVMCGNGLDHRQISIQRKQTYSFLFFFLVKLDLFPFYSVFKDAAESKWFLHIFKNVIFRFFNTASWSSQKPYIKDCSVFFLMRF